MSAEAPHEWKSLIHFQRRADNNEADPRIEAVMNQVCNLPQVKSLRFNGVEFIPNFSDILEIDADIWFEIVPLAEEPTKGTPMLHETVEQILSSRDHDITWIHRFVDQRMKEQEQEKRNRLGNDIQYFDQYIPGKDSKINAPKDTCIFTKSRFQSNRHLENIQLRQIDELRQRVDFFLKRKDWQDSKGVPHTLGIVMQGEPGCGKTSTIKAIANESKRHIFNIVLSDIRTKDALKDLFQNDTVYVQNGEKVETLIIPMKYRLQVIEDIDAMDSIVRKRSDEQIRAEEDEKIKKKAQMDALLKENPAYALMNNVANSEENGRLDLATLLNALDGVRETPGRIMILSTNYPERLDEALLRPGRFDLLLEFAKHDREVLKLHMEKQQDIRLTPKQASLLENPVLDGKWTPAEVSQILFRQITNPNKAIEVLIKEDPHKIFKFRPVKADATSLLQEFMAEIPTDIGEPPIELPTELPIETPTDIPALEPIAVTNTSQFPEDTDEYKQIMEKLENLKYKPISVADRIQINNQLVGQLKKYLLDYSESEAAKFVPIGSHHDEEQKGFITAMTNVQLAEKQEVPWSGHDTEENTFVSVTAPAEKEDWEDLQDESEHVTNEERQNWEESIADKKDLMKILSEQLKLREINPDSQ